MQAYPPFGAIGRILFATAIVLHGCSAPPDQADSAQPDSEAVAEPPGEGAVAFVDGRAVRWRDLQPILIELAGTEALGEIVLDRRLAEEARKRGITIVTADLDRERRLLRQTLSDNPSDALRLLDELRRRQGLGPHRFEDFLRRNAILRKLVQNDVHPDLDAAKQTFEFVHGEKREARIIIVPKLAEARGILDRIRAGGSFSELAVNHSTDPSAARGGLLSPVSRVDPSYPATIREVLWSLEIGDVSSPLIVEGGIALLRLERIIPRQEIAFDDVREEMLALARRARERILMEERARELVDSASITILNDVLYADWKARTSH